MPYLILNRFLIGPSVCLGLFIFCIAGAVNADPSVHPEYIRFLQNRAKELRLSEQKQWRKLGHYERSIWRGLISEADGAKFFTSPLGIKDPEAELQSTIAAFFEPIPDAAAVAASSTVLQNVPDSAHDLHPQCRFPARYRWLKEQLQFDLRKLVEITCPKFEKFKRDLSAKSVTLVFSSYYLNNPSSAFGHTLLRMNKLERGKNGEKYELLDYGINYAATVTTNNAVLYALYGLLGFFPGTYTSIPFYYKVREYNDSDSRDLWEYDLNFTPKQLEMMVAHIWELGQTYFDYFYLTENCSYHLMTVLEAANPDLELLTRLPSMYVIPADTVRVVYESPGLVQSVRYRPAARTVFQQRLETLNSDQKNYLEESIDEKSPEKIPQKFSAAERAGVLDTAIDYFDFINAKKLIQGDQEASAIKQKFLLARSKISGSPNAFQVQPPEHEMPHLGHGTSRFGLHGGSSGHGSFVKTQLRFALHDLQDPNLGYPRDAQIEFLNIQLQYHLERKSLWLEDLALFRVVSLTPWNRFIKPISWRTHIGMTTLRDAACDNCSSFVTDVGGGLTLQPISNLPASVYLLGEAEVNASAHLPQAGFRLGAGPAAGLRYGFSDNLNFMVESSHRYFFAPHTYPSFLHQAILRWGISSDFSVDGYYRIYPRSHEGGLGIYYYY